MNDAPVNAACDLFARVLARLDPAVRVAAAARDAHIAGDVVVVAVGKAAARMAAGAVDALGDQIVGGLVVAPEAEHVPPPLRMRVGRHPVPNAASERGGRALMDAVAGARPDQTVLALISGGASALACVPVDGLSLADKVAAVGAVMASGAPIQTINAVRKHLSAIKGGRLAALSPAPVVTFVSSDVVGDDVAAVGSGPTVPDPTTLADARAALDAVRDKVPAAVWDALASAAETPKLARPQDRCALVAGTGALVDAAAAEGATAVARDLTGDVEVVADLLAAAARDAAAEHARTGALVLLAANGEPTLRLPPNPGTGGRAQHLALLVAERIAGLPDVAVLAAGSDGIDGNSTAAGAVVTGATWAAIPAPARALATANATPALEHADALITTGRTGLNHADLFLIAAGRDSGIG